MPVHVRSRNVWTMMRFVIDWFSLPEVSDPLIEHITQQISGQVAVISYIVPSTPWSSYG
jgi:hypothetical protein